jgi:hypothetical protein
MLAKSFRGKDWVSGQVIEGQRFECGGQRLWVGSGCDERSLAVGKVFAVAVNSVKEKAPHLCEAFGFAFS